MRSRIVGVAVLMAIASVAATALCDSPETKVPVDLKNMPVGTWVKLSPLQGTPPSPRLGYEGACAWDGKRGAMIRYGGHNQGGGGEQGSEIWTFEPKSAVWMLKEPNMSPPGICCGQQNLIDLTSGRYLRFPAFSASHGWQWWREVYLNDASVWSYDLPQNRWRNLRPLPAAQPRPLRCASWDAEQEVVVMFGGEGSHEGTWTYDPWENTWTPKKPPLEPAPRSGGNMAYDARHKVHVLFGSQFDDDQHTWVYDLKANAWTALATEGLPPTKQNDAVLTYDSNAGVVLAVIKVTTGKDDDAVNRLETWTLDLDTKKWSPLKPAREPDPTSSRARQLMFAPELGLALLENRPSNSSGVSEQQIWALRLPAKPEAQRGSIKPKVRENPPVVEDVAVSVVNERQVEICWTPVPGKEVGYFVDRAAVEVVTEDQLKRLKGQTPPLGSPSVGAIRKIGIFVPLNYDLKPISATSYTDTGADFTKQPGVGGEPSFERKFHDEEIDAEGRIYRHGVYAYRVRAVNAAGKVSGPSAGVLTIPSSPQFVFAKEEGTTCHLKWKPNAEKGIRGYRVYRMDGRYNKDPIARLNAEPQGELTFTDPNAGKSSRRYYIVAVDALGQEGFPSSPVWFNREWEQFYRPFVKEWHQ
ncbi:MAG: hypothetical protein ACKVP0_16010 [Pirellulaceae bacterium]